MIPKKEKNDRLEQKSSNQTGGNVFIFLLSLYLSHKSQISLEFYFSFWTTLQMGSTWYNDETEAEKEWNITQIKRIL